GMMALAHPILLLLYPMQAEEVAETAVVFAIMSISTIPMSPMVTLTGALQGIDRQMLPVRNLAIGAVVKVILTYILVGIKFVNVNGASIGTIVCYVVATVLNIRDVKREAGVEFDFKDTYIKPLISSLVMGASAILSYKVLMLILKSNAVSCLLAICFAVLVYGVMVLVTKTITLEEIGRLPKGEKLVGLLRKFIK
ncbi:MAG: polysaccharide biosynthesis C-terminal domain-containing protein, partial [Firmicutes bacterium]|nr:polysaccharide biosynthesis C-terminal domain-containing protein [Bacillota bacterium]